MDPLTEDLWGIILVRLPLKIITSSKLVCKQWKLIVESPYFRELFQSHHKIKKSHSSWSLILRFGSEEVMAHYGCAIWGLSRSLRSYISSFIYKTFDTQKENVRIVAYTEVGLILICLESESGNSTFYVANPISQQCVKIPPMPLRPLGPGIGLVGDRPGLVTRIEKDVLLSYKVVLPDISNIETGVLSLLVYSSETGLWNFITLQSHPLLHSMTTTDPIISNGNIYWIGGNFVSNDLYIAGAGEIIISYDLYSESDQCRVIPFPDKGRYEVFGKTCTISQDFLMYANMFYENGVYKLRVWRKSREFQLVSEISPVTSSDYFPLGFDPFDGNIMYMWSHMDRHFASLNLYKGQIGVHNNLERSSDGGTLRFAREWDPDQYLVLYMPFFSRFVLPRWLHPIPSSPS